MKKDQKTLLKNFETISNDLDSLLGKTIDMILDSYSGTATENAALNYIERIKKLSGEIQVRMSNADTSNSTKENLDNLDEIEILIEQRNKMLQNLGLLV